MFISATLKVAAALAYQVPVQSDDESANAYLARVNNEVAALNAEVTNNPQLAIRDLRFRVQEQGLTVTIAGHYGTYYALPGNWIVIDAADYGSQSYSVLTQEVFESKYTVGA